MKNTLVLFTKSFPYNNDESFLLPELEILCEQFERVYIIPLIKQNQQFTADDRYQIVFLPDSVNENRWKLIFTYLFFCLPIEITKNFNFKGIVGNLRYHYNLFKQSYLRALILELKLKHEGISFENTVFYSYWLNENALSLAILKRKFEKMETVGRGHGYDVFPEQAKFGYNPFQATIIYNLNKIISVSDKGTIFLKQKYPSQAFKIKTSYLGTKAPVELSPVHVGVIRIVSCAHVRALKSIHRIPIILSLLDKPCEWVHLGGFKDETYKLNVELAIAQAKAKNPGLSVILKGELNTNELFDFYKKTAVTFFISLSTNEGLPVSMMEAISFGIPIFSTDVGGCKEICTEQTGISVDKSSTDEQLAAFLNEFIMYIAKDKYPRIQVRKFWEENFSAGSNYKKLIENNLQ